jgi:hypothetical protein
MVVMQDICRYRNYQQRCRECKDCFRVYHRVPDIRPVKKSCKFDVLTQSDIRVHVLCHYKEDKRGTCLSYEAVKVSGGRETRS